MEEVDNVRSVLIAKLVTTFSNSHVHIFDDRTYFDEIPKGQVITRVEWCYRLDDGSSHVV